MKTRKEDVVNESLRHFKEGCACSQSILLPYAEAFGLESRQAMALSSTFGGGMGRLRRTCGALTGAFMVLGLKYGNVTPGDMEVKLRAYRKVRELCRAFEQEHGSSICKEILSAATDGETIKKREHHRIICDKCVKTSAELTFDMVCGRG